jgi:hypothetical protein
VPGNAVVTNVYAGFAGTLSVANGNGWSNINDPPNGAFPGTIVFITVPPPAGSVIWIK